MTATSFDDLPLPDSVRAAIRRLGHETPLPVQAAAVPDLAAGRNAVVCAATGSGKTLAYLAPLSARVLELDGPGPHALVLAPTRELAVQIASVAEGLGATTGLTSVVVHGGVGFGRQAQAFARGDRIVVATPGRLRDLVGRGKARLDTVRVVVLDECDRMLERGFADDVHRLLGLIPPGRQIVLVSATVNNRVRKLAEEIAEGAVEIAVQVEGRSGIPEGIRHEVAEVRQPLKPALLLHLLDDAALERVLVFTRTRHRCETLARVLTDAGVDAAALHAERAQSVRGETLDAFREGRVRVLVATDLAERGLDVAGLTHVIHFDAPNTPDIYLHRVGRTARVFGEGTALSLVAASERAELEKMTRRLHLRLEDRPTPGFDHAQKPPPNDPFVEPDRPRKPRGRAAGGGRGAKQYRPKGPEYQGEHAQKRAFWERARNARGGAGKKKRKP